MSRRLACAAARVAVKHSWSAACTMCHVAAAPPSAGETGTSLQRWEGSGLLALQLWVTATQGGSPQAASLPREGESMHPPSGQPLASNPVRFSNVNASLDCKPLGWHGYSCSGEKGLREQKKRNLGPCFLLPCASGCS